MKKEILPLILFLFALPFVSGEILMTQPNPTYNVGDRISVQTIIRPNVQSEDFLVVQIKCPESYEVYRNFYTLNAGEEKIADITFPIRANMVDKEKICFIESSYASEKVESQRFKLSNEIFITLNIQNRIYDPGSIIILSGDSRKANGANANGFIEVSWQESTFGTVSDGRFNLNVNISSNVSGKNQFNIRIYEKDSNGNVTNEGNYTYEFEVRPVLSKIEVQLDNNEITPGKNVSYKVIRYDQSGNEIDKEVILTIYSPNGVEYRKEVVNGNHSGMLITEKNSSSGYWKMEASSGSISGKKLLYVHENEEATFSITNKTLTVTNVGNVRYVRPVEIFIGAWNVIKQVDLDVGKSVRYEISAPEGNYELGIKEGGNSVELGSISLTGKAVNVNEVKGGVAGVLGDNWIIWAFVILISALFGLMFAYKNNYITLLSLRPKVRNDLPKSTESLIGNGSKQNAAVICLDIRSLPSGAEEILSKAISVVKDRKASVHSDGEHRIIIFSPSLTKSNDNLNMAMSSAREIEKMFKEYNRKFKNKLEFGIGVNDGEIIAEKGASGLTFVSKSNLIREAKRISKDSKNEALVSDQSHRKLASKAEFKRADGNAWRIERIKGDEPIKKSFNPDYEGKSFGRS